MAITPNTEVYLIKNPLEMDNSNQLTFNDLQSQYNYFLSLPNIELNNFTYQRKDGIIRYPENIDNIIEYNYVMYKNENYGDKWFYAFINNMQYINDNMTEISIKTDVFQTWQFDLVYKSCFVEREHVNNDRIGNNTIPEQLETGEYIVEGSVNSSLSNAHVVICASYDIISDYPAGSFLNGIYQGCVYYLIRQDEGQNYTNAETTIQSILYKYSQANKLDQVLGLYMVPDELTNYSNITSWDHLESGGLIYTQFKKLTRDVLGVDSAKDLGNTTVNKPYSTIDGYYPKNNKLFTYPFIYINGTNNQGNSAQYRYEDFSTTTCNFKSEGVISPGCSIRNYPLNYKGKNNYEEGLNLGKYPICSYTSDIYTNWLTQNALNIGLGVTGSAVSSVAGAFTGNAIGVASGLLGIGQSIGQIYEHSLSPYQFEGNVNAGDVTYSSGYCKFTFNQMCIKKEYAKIIDDYFSMFGYKVNSVKIPNITGRNNWNYVKTIDCNIEAYIPQLDLQEIKEMFNKGITLWHNASTFLDYSQSNNII